MASLQEQRQRRWHVPKGHRDSFLSGYDKKINPALCPRPDVAFFLKGIKHTNDSSPGPDGIPFSAWRAVADLAAPVLYGVFDAVSRGHLPPAGFNHGLLYLLPKKDTGLVSDTRPLSVTNTDNRILAAAVAHSIMPGVDTLVDPSQRGFLAGKDGGEHITAINELFYGAIRKKLSRILFLLDTAKAFDSIDHDWITHVLDKVGFPPWFLNFVSGSLHEVKVTPFFGGPLVDWVDIFKGGQAGVSPVPPAVHCRLRPPPAPDCSYAGNSFFCLRR